MARKQELNLGLATVVPHQDGGWALPGRYRVETMLEASDALSEMNRAMANSLSAEPPARIVERVPGSSRTTRRAAKNDHYLVSRC